MKKILLFQVIFSLLYPCLLGASPTEDVIHQVQATYEKVSDVKSEFIQKVRIESLEREIEKTGKAFFKRPGKLRVEYEEEDGRLYISNGKKLWVYEKGDTQVNVYPVNPQTMPEETLTFLGGLGNLNAQFRVSALPKDLSRTLHPNQALDWLFLKPKNTSSQLGRLILGFDKNSHVVLEAYLKNETGNQSHYFFKNVVLNSGLVESQFEFEKPKGVKEVKN